MSRYTTKLPSINESIVEWDYSEGMPQLSGDQIKLIEESMDPFILERDLANSFLKTFLLTHSIFQCLGPGLPYLI